MSSLSHVVTKSNGSIFGDDHQEKSPSSTFDSGKCIEHYYVSSQNSHMTYEKAHSILTDKDSMCPPNAKNGDDSINPLSSSGPLDEGMIETLHPIDLKNKNEQAWKSLSQHTRTKTTPSMPLTAHENDHVYKKANLRVNFSSPNTKRTQSSHYKSGHKLEDDFEQGLSACAALENVDTGMPDVVKNDSIEAQSAFSSSNTNLFSSIPRRSYRSHTSQGFPTQQTSTEKMKMFLGLQNDGDIDGLLASLSHNHTSDAKFLQQELNCYKAYSMYLRNQNNELTQMISQRTKVFFRNGEGVPSPPPSATPFQTAWTSTSSKWQKVPELSPDSGTATTPKTFPASPDPFSPYEQPSPIPQHLLSPQSAKQNRDPKDINTSKSGFQGKRDSESVPHWYDTLTTKPISYMQGLKMDFTGAANGNDNPQQNFMNEVNNSRTTDGAMDNIADIPLSHYQHKNPLFSPSMFPPAFFPAYYDHPFGNSVLPQIDQFKKKTIDSNTPLDVLVKAALTPEGQEASIKLQQKLKSPDAAQREAAMDAISPHLHHLAYCRHGNFLVQRAISMNQSLGWTFANTFVKLSLSQYGCHVVQKLLDLANEDVRELIVSELLTEKLEETVGSRYAIHIWQKILDTQWLDSEMRPKIIDTLNQVLRGKWADIAMSETGSLICQNLFESGAASETEECMFEVVDRIYECASNQWGVWVVQYIIEHAGGEVKRKALSQMLAEAPRLSLSPHGQKAIMTAIRAKNPSFLAAYINILCEYDITFPTTETIAAQHHISSTRRSMLVDVATCTHGDQIVTQLLTSASHDQRDRIIKTVRKNSVYLKGSKAGLKIYQLCERARAFTGY